MIRDVLGVVDLIERSLIDIAIFDMGIQAVLASSLSQLLRQHNSSASNFTDLVNRRIVESHDLGDGRGHCCLRKQQRPLPAQ